LDPLLKRENITGLILAGGAGSRVSGQDKGLLHYHGQLMIEKQLDWLANQVDSIVISANRNLDKYRSYGFPVVTDLTDEFSGPLHGIYQGLQSCKTTHLYVHPVDVPFLPVNLVEQIISQLDKKYSNKRHDRALSCFLKSDEREHYLSMLIDQQYHVELSEFLNLNKRKVSDFHKTLGSEAIDLGLDESVFKNLNYLQDY